MLLKERNIFERNTFYVPQAGGRVIKDKIFLKVGNAGNILLVPRTGRREVDNKTKNFIMKQPVLNYSWT